MKKEGQVTLLVENGFLKEVLEIIKTLKADAIESTDEIILPKELGVLGLKIYHTYFVSGFEDEFLENNWNHLQQFFLSTKYVISHNNYVDIDLLEGYLSEQIKPDYEYLKSHWQVYDRTENKVVDINNVEVDEKTHRVRINNIRENREFSVSFLARITLKSIQAHNYNPNSFSKDYDLFFDPVYENFFIRMQEKLIKWLKNHKSTDIVKLTAFFYHFVLIFNELKKEKLVDWFGYGFTVSPKMLDDFEKEFGYKLYAEDFITNKTYNSTFNIPSKKYLDYIDFIQRFVARRAKILVDLVHAENKEAMLFLGDNWIGTEPYGKYFESIKVDLVAGNVVNGTTLRMISDIVGVKQHEALFSSYFFSNAMCENSDSIIETKCNWLQVRRAILRNPVDTIEYDGYLSLVQKSPKLIKCIQNIANEFRKIYENVKNMEPYVGIKVGILNSFGKLRSWQTHVVSPLMWHKNAYSYQGLVECLSGMKVDVQFISFDDLLKDEYDKDINVFINAGDYNTSFSGGINWDNPLLVEKIRGLVFNGKGFIGIGEPSSFLKSGKFFQLSDILGVDKELGNTLSTCKYFNQEEEHFILQDLKKEKIYYGEKIHNVYAINESTKIIDYQNNEIYLSSCDYNKGRGIYVNSLPFSNLNCKLLERCLYYSCRKEKEINNFYSNNFNVEVHYYVKNKKYCIVNNSLLKQSAKITLFDLEEMEITLKPAEIQWYSYEK